MPLSIKIQYITLLYCPPIIIYAYKHLHTYIYIYILCVCVHIYMHTYIIDSARSFPHGFFLAAFSFARSFPRRAFPLQIFSPLGLFHAGFFPAGLFQLIFFCSYGVSVCRSLARVRIEDFNRNRFALNGIQGIVCFIVFSSQLEK